MQNGAVVTDSAVLRCVPLLLAELRLHRIGCQVTDGRTVAVLVVRADQWIERGLHLRVDAAVFPMPGLSLT